MPEASIEDRTLDYDITIQDAQFNHESSYFLKFSIQSLFTKDTRGIQLKKYPSKEYVNGNEIITDVVEQKGDSALCVFKERKFVFMIPKGFCKNDRSHDVFLLIEAFTLPKNGGGIAKKVGEGKTAIYPRTNAPRTNLHVPPGDDMYQYKDVISLLRTTSTDSLQMHCGRLRGAFSLREHVSSPKKNEDEDKLGELSSRTSKTPMKNTPTSTTPRHPPPKPVRKEQPIKSVTPAKRDTPRKPRPSPQPQPKPTPRQDTLKKKDSWGDNLGAFQLPQSPPLSDFDGRKMPESPLPEHDHSTFTVPPDWRHVSKDGKEQIDVIFHGASGVPDTPEGKMPLPYATLKTKHDEEIDEKTEARTHAPIRPTKAPAWDEVVSLDIDENRVYDESLVVSVGDAPTKQGLAHYRMPVSNLKPFHQYHMEMLLKTKKAPDGVRVYATLTRKLPHLPKDMSCPNYLALEVLLQSVQKPLKNPVGPLIAVARIVPDYHNYKNDSLVALPRSAGVRMSSVTYPSPHPSSFNVPPGSKQGYPQISLLGKPEQQPTWDHPYLFCEERDKATLFIPTAALVIEYYAATTAMNKDFWRVHSPVAYSSILMGQEMYKQLSADRAKLGLRVEGLPVQGSNIVTEDGSTPTIGMILRLITTDTPDTLVNVSDRESLPLLDLYPQDTANDFYRSDADVLKVTDSHATLSTATPPPQEKEPSPKPPTPPAEPVEPAELEDLDRYFTRRDGEEKHGGEEDETPRETGKWILRKLDKEGLPRKKYIQKKYLHYISQVHRKVIQDDELPPYEAMDKVLPEYEYIFVDPNDPEGKNRTRRPPKLNPNMGSVDNLNNTQMTVLDQQMKEVEDYRAAVHTMGKDILALRQQVRDLENNNSQLRTNLSNYNDATKYIKHSDEIEIMEKEELAEIYAQVRHKLVTQTADLNNYKTRIQKLQNELIAKNEKEKEFLQMRHAHVSQQHIVQRLQEKVAKIKKLEETIKRQERVIEKMENLTQKAMKDKPKSKDSAVQQEAYNALLEENKRLRSNMEDLKDELRKTSQIGVDDTEKLELYQALEKAEGRIISLEKQLNENARQYGKERGDLMIKLNEANHGFGRANNLVIHDYPVMNDRYDKTVLKKLDKITYR